MCKGGFHACKNPFDVFNYYPPDGNTRFFEVEQSGDAKEGNNKTVAKCIEVKAELSLKQFFAVGFKLIFDKVKTSKKTTNTAGNYAHANTAGEEAIASGLGIQSKAKAVKGWIVIVDWLYKDNKWVIRNIHHAKVGRKIKGVTIKSDTYYWFKDGELKHETL